MKSPEAGPIQENSIEAGLNPEQALTQERGVLVPEQALEEEKRVLLRLDQMGGGKMKRIIAGMMLGSALVFGAGAFEANAEEQKQNTKVEQLEKEKEANEFTIKEGANEYKIIFHDKDVEKLMSEWGIMFEKETGVFNLNRMSAGGGKIFGLEFSGEGNVRTLRVDVYGRHKLPGAIIGGDAEISISINNSDGSGETILIQDGKIVSHRNSQGQDIKTPIKY